MQHIGARVMGFEAPVHPIQNRRVSACPCSRRCTVVPPDLQHVDQFETAFLFAACPARAGRGRGHAPVTARSGRAAIGTEPRSGGNLLRLEHVPSYRECMHCEKPCEPFPRVGVSPPTTCTCTCTCTIHHCALATRRARGKKSSLIARLLPGVGHAYPEHVPGLPEQVEGIEARKT